MYLSQIRWPEPRRFVNLHPSVRWRARGCSTQAHPRRECNAKRVGAEPRIRLTGDEGIEFAAFTSATMVCVVPIQDWISRYIRDRGVWVADDDSASATAALLLFYYFSTTALLLRFKSNDDERSPRLPSRYRPPRSERRIRRESGARASRMRITMTSTKRAIGRPRH